MALHVSPRVLLSPDVLLLKTLTAWPGRRGPASQGWRGGWVRSAEEAFRGHPSSPASPREVKRLGDPRNCTQMVSVESRAFSVCTIVHIPIKLRLSLGLSETVTVSSDLQQKRRYKLYCFGNKAAL